MTAENPTEYEYDLQDRINALEEELNETKAILFESGLKLYQCSKCGRRVYWKPTPRSETSHFFKWPPSPQCGHGEPEGDSNHRVFMRLVK